MKRFHYYFNLESFPRKNKKFKDKKFLLDLPYELRREVYRFSIIESRHPPAETVHNNWLSATNWKDRPSPLLWVNRQIRAEVFEFLQKSPFTMRVAWQDYTFDRWALSAFIAQQRMDCDDLTHLILEVWPPLSARPIDTILVWEHLRKIRDRFSEASKFSWKSRVSRVSRVDLVFLENSVATWSRDDGTPWRMMCYIRDIALYWSPSDNDMICMLALFANMTNVAEAHVHLPDSLLADGTNVETRDFARKIEESMMGLSGIEMSNGDAGYATWLGMDCSMYDLELDDKYKYYLERETAWRAVSQLAAMTKDGEFKLSVAEYDQFVTVWPCLGCLHGGLPGGAFKGMWHYVEAPETRSVSPAALLQELPFYEDS